MGDFSFRGVEVLRSVRAVLAEDTRHTRHLLERYEIATPMLAYHEHNEARMTPVLLDRLRAGEDLALVTDAGTPLVSDPGARLVRGAVEAGVRVVPVPGATAMLTALVASGIDAGRFTFFGFLPRKGRERAAAMEQLRVLPHTAVVYEAPSRLAGTLAELAELGMGERPAAVAREMTKQFEEVRRGTLDTLRAYYTDAPPRGEIVLVLAGAPAAVVGDDDVRARARRLRAEGHSVRDTAAALAAELGVGRNLAYRIAQEEE